MKRDFTEALEAIIVENKLLRGTADALQSWFTRWFLESPLRPLKTFLNGTWLEHPLHPVITDIPIGSWTVAIVLDLVALILGVANLGAASAIAMGLGVLAALGAIVTGIMDFTDTDPPDRIVAVFHALTNILATIFFAVSLYLLWTSNWTIDVVNFIVALLGYGLVMLGGFLGGSLVYRLGVMVNRNAFREGPKNFVAAISVNDLPENKPKRVDVQGQPILLVRRGQKIYAVGAVCSHYGGPLEKGKLDGDQIECPWHYSRFSITDGKEKGGPTTSPLPLYDANIQNGQVMVKLLRPSGH
jgi:nitrite reductase/ring-hydroxylating ferredoxin subunit/uncharacterized membrane protein